MNEKKKIVNYARVLLITDEEKYDKQIKKYGFKNIMRFETLQKAAAYFDKHSEELKDFNIIFEYVKRVHAGRAGNKDRFYCQLWNLDRQKSIRVEVEEEQVEKTTQKTYYFDGKKMKDLSDKEVLNEMIRRMTEKANCMEDIERKSKLRQKKDLKILFVSPFLEKENIRRINKKLGLNVELTNETDMALEAIENSNYAIIIAPNLRENVLKRNDERNQSLCMVASYEIMPITPSEEERIKITDLGKLVTLTYTLNRNEDAVLSEQYKVLGSSQEYYAESIISSLVTLYQLASLKNDGIAIVDCKLKDTIFYEKEYLLEEKEEIEKQKAILKPVLDYDELLQTLKAYFYYTYMAYNKPPKKLDGYEIDNHKSSYYVARTHKVGYLGAVSLSKENSNDKRMLSVALATSRGSLFPAESVGIYRTDYIPDEEEPETPNERQRALINLIENQLCAKLTPIIEKAKADYERKQENPPTNQMKRDRKRKKNCKY